MGDVYRKGGFEPDQWPLLADSEAVPAGGHVILPKARYLAERATFGGAAVGVLLHSNDRLDDLAADLGRIPILAIEFPKFNDGRGFSLARLLRERHNYRGELRAVGEVLLDLIPFMHRVGIDSFAVTHAPTRARLEQGDLPEVPFFYQPAVDPDGVVRPSNTRPWLRRAV